MHGGGVRRGGVATNRQLEAIGTITPVLQLLGETDLHCILNREIWEDVL